MDNQQATKWFAGILEGEGNFYGDSHSGYQISIHNTDLDIIEKCKETLRFLHILFGEKNHQKGFHKHVYTIYIQSQIECRRLYLQIVDFVQCRRQEFEQLIGAPTTTCEVSSDLYWLIGILEAEGCIHLGQQRMKDGQIYYKPVIEVDNTNFKIIQRIIVSLRSQNLPLHVYHGTSSKENRRETKLVTIAGFKRVARTLRAFKGLWISKRINQRAELLQEFCETRLLMSIHEPYTSRQHEIFHALKIVQR